jgi:A/G-specific adenine glycosylase
VARYRTAVKRPTSRSRPRREQLSSLRAKLLDWYDREHRDFPWRHTRDPYAVLVSEVMLQQTQASRVADAFPAFMDRFPTAASLAGASSAELLAAWSGLGYNRRALALQRAAAQVERTGWPRDVRGLEQLPGVGPYTARAVASLAFGQPAGVVDTNVRRWLTRRFGPRAAGTPAALQQLADRLATAGPDGRADAWTHATMEFGAAICRSRAPRCDACPIAAGCPSRDADVHVGVARQSPFAGSDRAKRGALLRRLSAADGHRLDASTALAPLAPADAERILAGLEADGLAHRIDGEVRLGSPTGADSADTIGT